MTELERLRQETAFHQRLREVALVFSRGVSSTLSLKLGLEALALEVNTLFAATRTSVWMHERRARELALAASSEPAYTASAARVGTEDGSAPAARGLRLEQPQVIRDADGTTLLAPLRGWRRALGTLVVEGPTEPEESLLVELAHELGRQLSAAIENVQLLEEVLRQRRLLEDTFNALIDLVIVTDNAMRVVQVNEAFAARTGLTLAQVIDQPIDTMVGERMASWAATQAPFAEPRSGSSESLTSALTERFDDERLKGIFAATLTPLINQDGEPVGRVLVARDITLQTRLESEREALRQRLAQSEKLASLGQFVAGIAHEMNNPLQGVLGHLELLLHTNPAAKPIKAELRGIYREADRAAKIVRNLLVFTGSRRMARRRLRIDRVIARAVASRNASLARHRIDVRTNHADTLSRVNGDPLLLHQAFLNIIINAEHAIAASAKSGAIDVTTTTEGDVVRATIHDSGPGIPEDALPRIFDPFFTTKEVGKGTGLGLAITYGIVQEHGGTIHAANDPGGGAQFIIELPVATA